jgi:hypothetical protein
MSNNFSGNCDLMHRPSIKEKYLIHEPKQQAILHQLDTLQYLQHHITQALKQDSALHYGVLNQMFSILHLLQNDLQAQLAPSNHLTRPIHLMPFRAARHDANLTEYETLVLEENELLAKLRTCQSMIEAILDAFTEDRHSFHLLTVEDVLTEVHTMELEIRTELLHLRFEKTICRI